jgi:RNA polymerase sigma-70 factor (ECF subfamily)
LTFREVLGWTAPEVAEVLGSTVASVNSALQRARSTIEVHLPEPTGQVTDTAERELLGRYVAVLEDADMDGLVALLREDATLRMPPRSLSGGLRIARFFLETVARGDLTRIRHSQTWANGRPAVTIEVRAEDDTWIPTGSPCSKSRKARSPESTRFLTPHWCRGSESRSRHRPIA